MRDYENVLDVIEDLSRDGILNDFRIKARDDNEFQKLRNSMRAHNYVIEESIHFGGLAGSPATNKVLYVINSHRGEKGYLIASDRIRNDDLVTKIEHSITYIKT